MPNMVTGPSATTFDPSVPASSSWRRLDDIASVWKSWKQANNVRIEPVFEKFSPEPTNLNKPTNPTRSVPVSKTRAATHEASNSTKSLPPLPPQEDAPKKEKKSGSPLPWQSPRAKALMKETAPQPKASFSSKSSGFLNRQRSISDQQSNLSPKPSLSRRQPATPPEPKPSSSTNPAKRMASFLQRNNTTSTSRPKTGSSPLRPRPSVSPPKPKSSTSPPRTKTGMLSPRPKATSSPPRPKATSSPPRPRTNSLLKSSVRSREYPTPAHRAPSTTSYSKPSLSSNTALLTQCIEAALLNRPTPSGARDPSQLLVPPPLKISKSPLPRRQHLTKSKSSLAMRASSILPPIVEQTLAEEEEEEEDEEEDEGQDGHYGFARTSKLIAPQSTKSSQKLSSPTASTSASRQRKSTEITITGSSNYRRVRKRSNPLRVAITPSNSGSLAKSDVKTTERVRTTSNPTERVRKTSNPTERVRTTSNPRMKALPDKAISESGKAVQETTHALVTPATVVKAHKTADETPASNSNATPTLPFVPVKSTVTAKGEKQNIPALEFSKVAVKVVDPIEESPIISSSFSTPSQRSLLSELLIPQPSITSTTSRDTKFTVKSKLELSAQRRRMLKQDSALRRRHHSFNCATDLGLEAVIDSMDLLDGKARSHPVGGLFGTDFTTEGRTVSGLTVSTFASTSLKSGAPRRHTMPEALLEAAADILQEALEEPTVW